MALTETWKLDSVAINGTGVGLIDTSDEQTNLNMQAVMGSGASRPTMYIGTDEQPRINFTTKDLVTVLTTLSVGIDGIALSSTSYQYWEKQGTTTPLSGSVHSRSVITEGLFYWTTINLPNQDIATADCVIDAQYDGTNLPITTAGSQALPSLTKETVYGMGPASINGTAIDGETSCTIANNISVLRRSSGSVPYPEYVAVQQVQPVVTITTINADTWKINGQGALNGTTGLVVYGRKYSHDKTSGLLTVANATLEHLRITWLNGTYAVQTRSASGNDPAVTTIEIRPVGTPTITTTVAIA